MQDGSRLGTEDQVLAGSRAGTRKKRLSREGLRSFRLMSDRIITEGAGDCKRGPGLTLTTNQTKR